MYASYLHTTGPAKLCMVWVVCHAACYIQIVLCALFYFICARVCLPSVPYCNVYENKSKLVQRTGMVFVFKFKSGKQKSSHIHSENPRT